MTDQADKPDVSSNSSVLSSETKKSKPQFKIDMPAPRIFLSSNQQDASKKPGSILVSNDDSSKKQAPASKPVTTSFSSKNHSTSSLNETGIGDSFHRKAPSVHAHFLEGEQEPGLRSRSGSASDRGPDHEGHAAAPGLGFMSQHQTAEIKKGVPTAAALSGSSMSSYSSDKKAQSSGGTSGTISGSSISVGDPRLPQDDGKIHILLGATGSISTGKLREIIGKLVDIYGRDRVSIQIILTKAAEHFVSRGEIPSSVRIWRDEDEWSTWRSRTDPIVHIELRRWADILVICPLSANTLGKIALGLCDNLLTNVVRAWNTQYPVVIAPAMLSYAYNHPATKRHLKVISEDMKWIEVLRPVEKVVGSYGDIGMGGMMDWIQIVDRVVMKLGGYPKENDEDENDEDQDEEEEDTDDDDDDGNGSAGKADDDESAIDDDLGVSGMSLADEDKYKQEHKKLRSSKSFT